MKKLVKESLRPESKEQFLTWLDTMIENNSDDDFDWEWLIASLVNDESSLDDELVDYFIENGVKFNLAKELVNHREGFLNYGLDISL
jgi:hypothetical protein